MPCWLFNPFLPPRAGQGRVHAVWELRPAGGRGRCAAARAPTAVNNGAGLEEKGNLLGEAAGESSLLLQCQRAATAAGFEVEAPRERAAHLRAGRLG